MTQEELTTYIVANSAAYIAARSTVGVPLAALEAKQVYAREFRQPSLKAEVWVDIEAMPIETEGRPLSGLYIQYSVDVYVFCLGSTEAILRQQAKAYALALYDCLSQHPDYMMNVEAEAYEGVEGKPDTKCYRIRYLFETEEA
ncbi:MAG: hypothetical protein AB7T74_02315 [Clostridia bacterium]